MKILLFVTLAIAVCFTVYAATDSRAGVWTAELVDDKVQMTLFQQPGSSERRGMGWNNTMGFDDTLSAYSGITKADFASNAANVQFELRRAAGVIAFEGRVANGTGAGHFKFTPSDAFIRDMENLGYRGFSENMLLVFAAHDFSPATLKELKAMGYQPTQHEVEEIAIFRVTPEFLREVGRAGYPNLTLREAVNFRVGRVDAAYISELRALGYTNLSAHKLADMAILGVSPKYIRDLKSAGLSDLTAQQLSDLRVGNVTAARIEEYRKLGYTNLSAHQLSEMGIFGVTPEYIRKLSEKGYDKVPIDKLLQLRTMGADKILFKEKEKD